MRQLSNGFSLKDPLQDPRIELLLIPAHIRSVIWAHIRDQAIIMRHKALYSLPIV